MKQNFTGYLGTGISKVNFFRKVMVIIVADFDGKLQIVSIYMGGQPFLTLDKNLSWLAVAWIQSWRKRTETSSMMR
ncbi:hypothetical protein ABW365_24455 [Enterococcus avium]